MPEHVTITTLDGRQAWAIRKAVYESGYSTPLVAEVTDWRNTRLVPVHNPRKVRP